MTNPLKGRTGFGRIVRATGYSFNGLKLAYAGESAFRQETWLAIALVPMSFVVGRSWVEVALLAGSAVLVMIVELLNSAVEACVDRISFEMHDLSKRAKDLGSAAVFLALMVCVAIWVTAIWNRVSAGI